MPDNPFVGVWNLVSCEAVRGNRDALPIYGKNPIGRLYYDASGNMSVHIMRAGRPAFSGDTKFRATPDEMRAAYESYEAYFSTYKIDELHSTIHHTVTGSLFPNWTGSVQSRHYLFEGNRLVLSTDPVGYVSEEKTTVTLVWERIL